MFEEWVGWEHWVVWFNDGGWNLGWWVDGESELGFLTVVDWESFEEERSETWSSTTTDWVEDEETLESCALISELSDSVKAEINDFFTDCVVTSGEVVGGIFFTWDELLRVEELSVSSSSNFIDDSWFQVEEDTSWDVLSSSGFWEEGVEGVVSTSNGLVRWHLTIGLDTVFKAEEFPAGVTNLDTGLSDVNWDDFSHDVEKIVLKIRKIIILTTGGSA